MPIAASCPARSGSGRLLLNDRVDLLVEREVIGVHRIEVRLGDVDELDCGRAVGGSQRIDPCFLQGRDAAQGPEHYPVGEGERPIDEVAIRHVAFVAGR